MAATVLGKRTRSARDADASPVLPSAKRPSRPEKITDENDNPFVTRSTRRTRKDVLELDELANVTPMKPSPAKHGVAERRAALSPTLIKTHFNISKSNNTNTDSKVVQIATPQTPRHRDALSKQAPVTPRHRVTVTSKAFTPRTPRTPTTPSTAIMTVYNRARQLFTRSSDPGKLIGRDAERRELVDFVENCIESKSGGCTYVSGPPGTGKSAFVHEITAEFEGMENVDKAYINCMSMKTSTDVFGTLLESFCEGQEIKEGDEMESLQRMFMPKDQSAPLYLVTLDEIDHILTLDLEVLYKLFEWSLQRSSHLILIGIANALDLTDRFLPRLKARSLKPQLLPFLPYNATQIKTVIIGRLRSLLPTGCAAPDYIPFLHPAAIELCSRKVSSQTGDLRKAFDICRKAIDLIESETKQKHQQALDDAILLNSPSKMPLKENLNLASSASNTTTKPHQRKTLAQSLATITVENAPRASISHVNKISSAAFSNGASQRLKALNLQQKAALCALVALEKKKRRAAANVMATPSKSNSIAPTIKALYETYCMLCTRDSILVPLTSTEFRDVVGSLETLSLISAVDGRNGSFIGLATPSKRRVGFGAVGPDEKRVGSCVSEREVEQAVEGLGAGILKSILSGEGL